MSSIDFKPSDYSGPPDSPVVELKIPEIPRVSLHREGNRHVDAQSLKAEYEAASQRSSGSSSSYLQGFMGLTGICMGFALETAERIETAFRLAKPLHLAREPTARTQHLEKLLVLAVFQTIGKQDAWCEIRREWDPELAHRIEARYQALIREETRGVVVETLPNQGYAPFTQFRQAIEQLPQAFEHDHYLVLFSNQDEPIYSDHMVYFHPQSEILADGKVCLSWQAAEKSQALFLKTAADYFEDHYGNYKEFRLFKLRFDAMPSYSSLLQKKISLFFSTLYHVARYSVPLAARFAISSLVPCHYLSQQTYKQEIFGSLTTLLATRQYGAFIDYVQKLGSKVPTTLDRAMITDDPKGLMDLLSALEKLDPAAERVSVWLQRGLLDSIKDGRCPLSAEEKVQVVRDVLRSRKRLHSKYPVSEYVQYHGLFGGDLNRLLLEEFFKVREFGDSPGSSRRSSLIPNLVGLGELEKLILAVGYGADPFAPSYYEKGEDPIDIARFMGHENVVEYLERLKASRVG